MHHSGLDNDSRSTQKESHTWLRSNIGSETILRSEIHFTAITRYPFAVSVHCLYKEILYHLSDVYWLADKSMHVVQILYVFYGRACSTAFGVWLLRLRFRQRAEKQRTRLLDRVKGLFKL